MPDCFADLTDPSRGPPHAAYPQIASIHEIGLRFGEKLSTVRLDLEALEDRLAPHWWNPVSIRLPPVDSATSGSISIRSVSDDGNWVVFTSSNARLVANDTNNFQDVFLFNRTAGSVTLVSRNGAGSGSGNFGSSSPVISGDGEFIAFTSQASNLVNNDSNSTTQDVFVYDRVAGTIALVSRNGAGTGSGNSSSFTPVISGDGAYIAFESFAGNLVSNDSNDSGDVFVFDRVAGTISLVSRNGAGTGSGNNQSFSPVISANGKLIAFDEQRRRPGSQ